MEQTRGRNCCILYPPGNGCWKENSGKKSVKWPYFSLECASARSGESPGARVKESETREILEEYAPLDVLAPVVQKLDNRYLPLGPGDLARLNSPCLPFSDQKESQCKILLYQSATAKHSACQGNCFRLYWLHVQVTLIEESTDFESRRC